MNSDRLQLGPTNLDLQGSYKQTPRQEVHRRQNLENCEDLDVLVGNNYSRNISGIMNSRPTNLNDNIPRGAGDSCSDLESLGYDTESSAGSTEEQHEETREEVIDIGSSSRFQVSLKVMYTNPDVLLNKRDEMMTRICEVNPDII